MKSPNAVLQMVFNYTTAAGGRGVHPHNKTHYFQTTQSSSLLALKDLPYFVKLYSSILLQ